MIVFIGLAGSGKSTQAKILADKLACPRLSVGDLLRASLQGKDAARMLAGELIEDDKLLPLLDSELKRLARREFILDGSPRTPEQARWLVDRAKEHDFKITAVIHLNASKQTVRGRLLKRGRADDYEAAINERFNEYETKILPIITYLKDEGAPVHEIDGEQTEVQVAHQIYQTLKGLA